MKHEGITYKIIRHGSAQEARAEEYDIYYKSEQVGVRRLDFLVEKTIPVELTAATELSDINIEHAKIYIEASGIEIGLLINFGTAGLQFKRMINNKDCKSTISPSIQ